MSAWQELVKEEMGKGGGFGEALKRAKARYHKPEHKSNPEHRRNDDLGEQVEHGVGLGFGGVVGITLGLIGVSWVGDQIWKWANRGTGPSP